MSKGLRGALALGGRLGRGLLPVLLTVAVCATSRAASGKNPDLIEIAQKLQQWRSSFVNVRLTWEYWNPRLIKGERPARDDTRYSRAEWIWSDVGQARHEYWAYYQGRLIYRQALGSDGPKLEGFRATYPEPPEKPGFLGELELLRTPSPQPSSSLTVIPLIGLYRAYSGKWLGETLAEGKATLEKFEDLEGSRCARVRVGPDVLWLDSARDFLVKRIRPASEKEGGTCFDVEEHERLKPGIWFPKRGSERRSIDPPDELIRWFVMEIAFNQAFDAKLFQAPPPMPGTHVVDARVGKSYVYGEKRRGEMREGQIAEEAENNLSGGQSPVSAANPGSRALWWSALLLAGSLVLLVIGCRVGRRLLPVILAVAVCATPRPASGKAPDLAEIALTLKRWRSSFVNVRLVWETWDPNYIKDKDASRPSPDDRFNRHEWIWSDVGAARHEFWLYSKGRAEIHELEGCDARKVQSFRATYPEKPEKFGFLSKLELLDMSSAQPKSSTSVEPLAELYRPYAARWLGDTLAEGKGTLEGYDDIGGAPCARVKIPGAVLWLDEGHDFLVRRIRPATEEKGGSLFDAEEFQRVGGVWFPKRGSYGARFPKRTSRGEAVNAPDEVVRWLVTDATVNQAVDAKLFAPPAPSPGMLVQDVRTRKSYIHGQKRPGEMREGQIAEEAQKNVSEGESGVSAATPGSHGLWWSALLLVVSLVLLLIGVLLWRRS
jgi:hypothetical protein